MQMCTYRIKNAEWITAAAAKMPKTTLAPHIDVLLAADAGCQVAGRDAEVNNHVHVDTPVHEEAVEKHTYIISELPAAIATHLSNNLVPKTTLVTQTKRRCHRE